MKPHPVLQILGIRLRHLGLQNAFKSKFSLEFQKCVLRFSKCDSLEG